MAAPSADARIQIGNVEIVYSGPAEFLSEIPALLKTIRELAATRGPLRRIEGLESDMLVAGEFSRIRIRVGTDTVIDYSGHPEVLKLLPSLLEEMMEFPPVEERQE